MCQLLIKLYFAHNFIGTLASKSRFLSGIFLFNISDVSMGHCDMTIVELSPFKNIHSSVQRSKCINSAKCQVMLNATNTTRHLFFCKKQFRELSMND